MPLKMTGKITHYANSGDVKFEFQKYNDKKSKGDEVVIAEYNTNLAFEIWRRFKGSDVIITVTKK